MIKELVYTLDNSRVTIYLEQNFIVAKQFEMFARGNWYGGNVDCMATFEDRRLKF